MEEDPIITSKASKKYFENIKSNYQDYLEQQLKEPVEIVNDQIKTQNDKDNDGLNDNEQTTSEIPEEKVEVIERSEFVDLIVDSLEIDTLTFAQKGKLYELWSTFKEFNPKYLTSIIEDIKDKTKDYNDNFLYYLAQIKKLYQEKLKKKSKKTKGGN